MATLLANDLRYMTLSVLWYGIRSTVRKEYKNGYIILDKLYIEKAIQLIAEQYNKGTQILITFGIEIIEEMCEFMKKRGFVVNTQNTDITISWPFYFL